MNFWNKRIKNDKRIASVLNVDEDKIKALKSGELEIGGETMNRTLRVLEDEKINKNIRDFEVWKWVQETDFKKIREEFGYRNQKEVANLIGVDNSTLSLLETNKGRFKRVAPSLIKVYEFYHNDFNKKLHQPKKVNVADKTREKMSKDNRAIMKWYRKTNIRELRKSMNLTAGEVAKLIGSAQSCITDLETKRFQYVCGTMIKAYNFYNNIDDIDKKIAESKNNNEKKVENKAEIVQQVEQPIIKSDPNARYSKDIAELEAEIRYLKILNEKYELLIDKLIGKI